MYRVYAVVNMINHKVYIGYTKNSIQWRWSRHYSQAKVKPKCYFHSAIKKYGKGNFYISELETTPSFEEVKVLEKKYIMIFKSNDPTKGYNLTSGGDGYKMTDAAKQKMSISHKGKHLKEKNSRYVLTDDKLIAKLYAKGMTTQTIADKLGHGDETIRRRLIWLGIPRRFRLTEQQKDEIVGLYKQELGCYKIGKIMGIDRSTVIRAARRQGLIIRNPKRKQ